MDDDDFDYLMDSTPGHFIRCEDCWRRWSIDNIPGSCRMTGCEFPAAAKQWKEDVERLQEMRDDYGSSLSLSIE